MMSVLFYSAAVIALAATGLALTRANAAHALIYLIVSLLAIAVTFFLMGAPFAAALEIMAALLLLELLLALNNTPGTTAGVSVDPKAVGLALFGPYVLAVEIASMLLLAGLIGAYHLGRRFIVRYGDRD